MANDTSLIVALVPLVIFVFDLGLLNFFDRISLIIT